MCATRVRQACPFDWQALPITRAPASLMDCGEQVLSSIRTMMRSAARSAGVSSLAMRNALLQSACFDL